MFTKLNFHTLPLSKSATGRIMNQKIRSRCHIPFASLGGVRLLAPTTAGTGQRRGQVLAGPLDGEEGSECDDLRPSCWKPIHGNWCRRCFKIECSRARRKPQGVFESALTWHEDDESDGSKSTCTLRVESVGMAGTGRSETESPGRW